MKAVVLFEGCGGSTRGIHDAGYTTVGYDHWQPAVTCAQANGFDSHLHDLADPTGDHLVPYAPLWWASPPCQPFSAAGAGDGEFDDRDGFPWLLRLVALRLPEVLIVENVKGLTFRKHSAYFCAVLEGFRALGYEVDWRVLNSADVGVPQTRERCIIVCRRDGGRIVWPMPTHCETGGMFTARWVTMADALGWHDGRVMGKMMGVGMIERHGDRPGRALDEPAFTIRADGGGSAPGAVVWLNPGMTPTQPNRRHYDPTSEPAPTVAFGHDAGNWAWERPATTIAGDNRVFQPGGHHQPGEQSQNAIRLTTAELATLQGFPSDWTWTGTKTQQARMIGNACPAPMVEAIVRANPPKESTCPRAIAS